MSQYPGLFGAPHSTPESVAGAVDNMFSDGMHTMKMVLQANPTSDNQAALNFLKGQQAALQQALEPEKPTLNTTSLGKL